ncbi:hypothetical protein ACOMCU_01810 [Lysinibacillus sp. UGB7]
MGSTTFIEEGVGRDAEEIFKGLVAESREYHGARHYRCLFSNGEAFGSA